MSDQEQLKIDINTLIWMRAPSKMTLEAAEEMANEIFRLFMAAQEKFSEVQDA